jgi:cytochrome c oxidase cbb3-type subunit 3
MQAAEARYAPIYERFAAMEFDELVQDQDALDLGRSLYASYCTTCHGSDARGAPGYPNLTDNDWQWGGTEQDIITTLTNGRVAVMTPWAQILGSDEAVDNMVAYVQSLSGIVDASDVQESARTQFTTFCAACHMPDGTGNQVLGAPNLTDDIWLYGGDAETIRTAIEQGRNGQMPAHGEFLGENRVRILAAYVYSLSQ